MQIFVKNPQGKTTTLNVESNERVCSIRSKLKEKEGIHSDLHLGLMYNGKLLEDGHTIAYYYISKGSTLRLFLSQDGPVETYIINVKTWSEQRFTLNVMGVDTIDDVKAKIQAQKSIPPHKQLLFYAGQWLEDGRNTLADYRIYSLTTLVLVIQHEQDEGLQSAEAERQTKRARPASPTKATSIFDTCDGEATAALNKENKKNEEIAQNKEKELEATISGLKAEYKKNEEIARSKEKELEATISGLKAENNKTEEELTLAQNKEKELEATISRLKAENMKIEKKMNEEIARNKEKELETTISGLKAGNKKTEEELTLARKKEKELEATICALTHKNKLFSDQCASYESLVEDLEVENKKTKEELMNADKKYYAGARAAGYAEGLKEGKAKRLKFLHCLNDTSMRYFNHGFNSCQKQAEEQGFCGQLNKNSALKDAPEIKGWESSDQPH